MRSLRRLTRPHLRSMSEDDGTGGSITMHHSTWLLALVLAFALSATAIAADDGAEPPREAKTAQKAAAAEKKCTSVTNACIVCSVKEGRIAGCSNPGIACTAGKWVCNSHMFPEK